jgi:hypothetical protein
MNGQKIKENVDLDGIDILLVALEGEFFFGSWAEYRR